MKKVVIRDGKKYIVNVPDYGTQIGWEGGIGAGCPQGTLWMKSTDGNWYAVNITGTSGSAATYVNQTALTYQDNTSGVQLVACDDGNSYVVSLSGTPPTVTIDVNQTPFPGTADPKPDLLLKSITDGNFYIVNLIDNAGTIETHVNQTYISGSQIVDI